MDTSEKEKLLKIIAEQERTIAELRLIIEQQALEIKKLKEIIWGKKSEKSKKKPKPDKAKPDEASSAKRKRGGGGRKGFPKNIRRKEIRIDLSDEEKHCAECGKEYEKMGVEISEMLHFIPAILIVLQIIRRRYVKTCACGKCREIALAEMPVRNIDKGAYSTEFIAAALVNKYCDHLPIHRQFRRLLKSSGVSVSESSFCRWRDTIAEQLTPLAKLMKEKVLRSYCINTDATTAKYRIPAEHHRLVNGNQYVYIGGVDAPYIVWDFQNNQSSKGIHIFLNGFDKFIQCDAHGNYDALFNPLVLDLKRPPPVEVGCHAHCRRKFKDIETQEPEIVEVLLSIWRNLYRIEKEIKYLSVSERLVRRQSESVPLLDQLFDSIRAIQGRNDFLPKSALGLAVAYALKNEAALRRYASDGRLSIDNNVSERTLRGYVIGRKNWLFSGSAQAAKYSSVILTLLSSASRHGLNEYEYLVDVLYRLSDLKSLGELEELLPDNWVKSTVPPTEFAKLVAEAMNPEPVRA